MRYFCCCCYCYWISFPVYITQYAIIAYYINVHRISFTICLANSIWWYKIHSIIACQWKNCENLHEKYGKRAICVTWMNVLQLSVRLVIWLSHHLSKRRRILDTFSHQWCIFWAVQSNKIGQIIIAQPFNDGNLTNIWLMYRPPPNVVPTILYK